MSPDDGGDRRHVVVVGGGFAGLGCVKRLAKEDGVRITLIDRHNYHQFQPLLYQVATSQLASNDIAFSLRKLFREHDNVDVKLGEVTALDPATRTVTLSGGERFSGDALVVAAGSRPNFFRTPGAEEHALPLYSLDDATRLRSRILEVFEAADRDPALVEQGALTFVVVGGGPTGVELAGALADLIAETMTVEYHHLAVTAAQIHLVDLGHTLLGPFSDSAHDYAAKILGRKGVRLHLGVAVTEVGAGHATLADGTTIPTRCVVWGGGIQAPAIATSGDLPRGRGARRRLRGRRHRQHRRPGRSGVPAAGFRGAAERHLGCREHPRRRRRQAAHDVPLPRQGDHGDDRARRGDRRGRAAPPRAPRRHRLLRLAGRPRLAHDRRAQSHRRLHQLGLGLLHQGARTAGARPRGRRADRLGRRRLVRALRRVVSL
jgi:NADH dehydrogenase FAD-containing subunit